MVREFSGVRNLYIRFIAVFNICFIAKDAPFLPLYSTVVYLLATMGSQSPLAVCCSRDYSNAGRMFAATGITPLLGNLESMTSKPSAGGGSKDGVALNVEKAVDNCVYADKVTTDSSTD